MTGIYHRTFRPFIRPRRPFAGRRSPAARFLPQIIGYAGAIRKEQRFEGLPNGADGAAPSRPVLSYLF